MSDAPRLLLVGATGMVGAQVAALAPPTTLTVVTRRPTDIADGAMLKVASVDSWAELITAARPDIVINTLGTTIKQSGSQAAFRAVDHDLVLAVARAAKDGGARQFISVSSVGASAKAGNFYLRTKGKWRPRCVGWVSSGSTYCGPDCLPARVLGQRGWARRWRCSPHR